MGLGNPANVRVEPCKAIWGRPEIQTIDTVADVAGSLNNTYVDLEFPKPDGVSVAKYRCWFDVNSTGTAPAAGGRTLVEVDIATGATAAAVASALAADLAALAEVASADVSSDIVTVEAKYPGAVVAAANGASSPAFTYAVTQTGFGGDLGLIDGNIEINHSEQSAEVKGQQSGSNLRDEIRTGKEVSVAITLKETSAAQLKLLYGKSGGGSFTPTSGTEVFGWGTSKDFMSKLDDACKLVLHPVKNDDDDHSEDFFCWLAYPELESLTFSGEEITMVPVNFKVLPDYSKKDKLRWFGVGDHTQDLSSDAAGT